MKKGIILVKTIITSLLLVACAMSGDPSDWASSDFSLINSPANYASRLDILYNKDFSGTISYIVSSIDLKITNVNQFNASTVSKKTVIITPEKDSYTTYKATSSDGELYPGRTLELTSMLNYIAITSLSGGTKYYVYIIDNDTAGLTVLSETTKAVASAGQSSYTGTITGTDLSYTISYPAGYDSTSSRTWPLVISVKGPNITASDPNFPCITFNTDTNGSAYFEEIKDFVTVIINDSSYKIDKTRIYGCGFSAGSGAVLYIANNCSADGYNVKALAINGCSGWAGTSSSFATNLGDTDVWISGGENDRTAFPWDFFIGMPKTSGDHFLSLFSGVGHDSSLTWNSPYTWLWLLGK